MPKQVPIDMLNDSTKEVVYIRKNAALFKKIAKQTRFDLQETKNLCLIHRKIDEVRGALNRSVFRDIFHSGLDFTENIRHLLVDRIYSQIDVRNTLQVPVDDLLIGMSTILRAPLNRKTKFAYEVYDLMKNSKLTKEQIFPMLRGCFIKLQAEEDPDETVRDMIELLVKAIDFERDGDISPQEFEKAVTEKNPLFLECMGPVFPSREARYAFLTTFTDKLAQF